MTVRVLNIGMIDTDLLDNGTRHPNIAQMKMSAYCKERGHTVRLLFGEEHFDNFDLIIVSKVFTFTTLHPNIQSVISQMDLDLLNTSIVETVTNLEKYSEKTKTVFSIGGTGFFTDGGRNLDDKIEHIMPDYHLYDDYIEEKVKNGWNRKYFDDYESCSIGFTSRGCFRKCSFCVNKKYDHAFRHAHVSEFLDETRPIIYLWDDNIFALKHGWAEVFEELKSTGKPFQFRQGLDIRLMTTERAKILSGCKYHGDFIFAFDHIRDEKIITEKLELWRKYTNKTTKLYVLCGFEPIKEIENWDSINVDCKEFIRDEMHEYIELQDIVDTFKRIKILMKYGCIPYIMRYESYKKSHFKNMYIQLARWCNQPEFYKKKSFREYCIANQEYTKTTGKNCVPYKTMIEFETKYPDIAKDYFDIKYDQTNEYSVISGYARTTSPCPVCIENATWDGIVYKTANKKKFLEEYYQRRIDTLCLTKERKICSVDIDLASQRLIDLITTSSYEEIIEIIDNSEPFTLESNTIPQPGNLNNGTINLLKLFTTSETLTYEEIGEKLLGPGKKVEAYRKYGESHSKFAALLDLVVLSNKRPITVMISPVGKLITNMNEKVQMDFFIKQILRIPIIQNIIRDSKIHTIYIEKYLKTVISSPTTVERRLTAVKFILGIIKDMNKTIDDRLNNILDG